MVLGWIILLGGVEGVAHRVELVYIDGLHDFIDPPNRLDRLRLPQQQSPIIDVEHPLYLLDALNTHPFLLILQLYLPVLLLDYPWLLLLCVHAFPALLLCPHNNWIAYYIKQVQLLEMHALQQILLSLY